MKKLILGLIFASLTFAGQLSKQDVQPLFTHGHFEVINSGCPVFVTQEIDSWLFNFRVWGLNPANVKVDDFDHSLVLLPKSPIPGLRLNPSFVCVFKHKKTSKIQDIGVQVPSQYPSAQTLIGLSNK